MHNTTTDLLTAVLKLNDVPGYDAWFSYSGHTELIYIRVAYGGYENIIYTKRIYLDEPRYAEHIQKTINDLRNITHATLPR